MYDPVSQGLEQVGVDLEEAGRAREVVAAEESWRETSRLINQEGLKLGSIPLVIDTLTRWGQKYVEIICNMYA